MYFDKPSIPEVYKRFIDEVKIQILHDSAQFIIDNDVEELVEHYFNNRHFEKIRLDTERQETIEFTNEVRLIPAHKREMSYRNEGDLQFEYELAVLNIPIVPNSHISEILKMRPSTFSISWTPNEVTWKSNLIEHVVEIKGYGFKRDDDSIVTEIQQQKNQIYSYIHQLSSEIDKCDSELKNNIRQAILNRRQEFAAKNEKVNSLLSKINMTLKTNEETTKKIELKIDPVIAKFSPSSSITENLMINHEDVLKIINFLDNQGCQFEKTPKSFIGYGEEDFRNVLLVNLNSIFVTQATGETFNAKGKTDIYLNISKGNILVCECKIWNGQKLYTETIDQLIRYLTWRENFGIIITFIKNKDASKVLTEVEPVIITHISYKSGFVRKSNTHFISHHKFPDDNLKSMELHHLFYKI